MSEINKQVVVRFIHAMSEGDAKAIAECLAPEAVAITKGFSKFSGSADRDTIVKLTGSMKDLVPTGLRVTIDSIIADGDAVAVEFEGNATTVAGTSYPNQYCMVFRLAEGKIVRTHEYFCTRLAEEVLWPIVEQVGLAADAGTG